eukprot:363784-Chlamydomonas_euryale.AAC.20
MVRRWGTAAGGARRVPPTPCVPAPRHVAGGPHKARCALARLRPCSSPPLTTAVRANSCASPP